MDVDHGRIWINTDLPIALDALSRGVHEQLRHDGDMSGRRASENFDVHALPGAALDPLRNIAPPAHGVAVDSDDQIFGLQPSAVPRHARDQHAESWWHPGPERHRHTVPGRRTELADRDDNRCRPPGHLDACWARPLLELAFQVAPVADRVAVDADHLVPWP